MEDQDYSPITGPSDAIERIRQLVGGSCPEEVADRAIAIIMGAQHETKPE